jgi:hypothetical protein
MPGKLLVPLLGLNCYTSIGGAKPSVTLSANGVTPNVYKWPRGTQPQNSTHNVDFLT